MLCASAVLMAGCGGANAPENAAGVRALYRAVGLDASGGSFNDICATYMDEQLRNKLKASGGGCTGASLERWAEGIRRSNVGQGTRIVVFGGEAAVYHGVKPERALYVKGQWQLAEVPQLTAPRQAAKR